MKLTYRPFSRHPITAITISMVAARWAWRPLTASLALAGALVLLILGVFTGHVGQAATLDREARQPRQALAASGPFTGTQWTPPNPAYRVSVVQDGFHVLTYTDLQAAGLPVDSLDPRTFQMFWMGQEMAILVSGEGDGSFDPGDEITFYARSIDSLYQEGLWPDHKYTGTNIYWLTYGQTTGLRMATVDGTPTGTPAGPYRRQEHREDQFLYVTEYPRYKNLPMPDRFDPTQDHWFMQKVQVFGPASSSTARSYSFTLHNVTTTASLSGTVSVRVVGGWDDVHGLRIKVNGTVVYENSTDWKDFEQFTVTAPVTQSLFVEGNNQITLEFFNPVGFVSEVYVDWIKLAYYRDYVALNDRITFDGPSGAGPWAYSVRNFSTSDIWVFDVTDLHQIRRVINGVVAGSGPYQIQFGNQAGGRRYVVLNPSARRAPASVQPVTRLTSPYAPGDLLDTGNGADWIAIVHPDFWDEIQILAAYRAITYRVALVDVQQIYDQFNGGMMSAEAIREFLRYAYNHWQKPAPKYVLLVGGGTNDMRHYKSDSKPTYIPPFLWPADPTLGETAADNRFVLLAGNDILPDMHIGRFPAYSEAEVTTMVSKTLHYEATPPVNDWNTNILMISDDLEGGGGNFYRFHDELAEGYADPGHTIRFMPAPYTATKVYLGQTCDTSNPPVAMECKQMISETLHITGALFTSYVGHAQKVNWAVEYLMDIPLADSLRNYDKLSIFLPMACFEGFFHESPQGFRSLSEHYLFNPNGGAVASWSPTGFGVATGHDWLEKGLFLAVFNENITTLGAATDYGKQYMYDNAPQHKYDDLIDTFLLFGDPALNIQVHVGPTAVDVAGLNAEPGAEGVWVRWQTGNEREILGFHVQRAEDPAGPFQTLTTEPILAQYPGSAQSARYAYLDRTAAPGQTYWYRLEVLKTDGTRETYGLAQLTPASDRQLFLPVVTR